ncbi:hypothetical protein ACTOVN_00190 [Arcanobacterium canis]
MASRREINKVADQLFADEIAKLDRKKDVMRRLIELIEQAKPLHVEIVKLRDELEQFGMSKTKIVHSLAPSPLIAKLLKTKIAPEPASNTTPAPVTVPPQHEEHPGDNHDWQG